MNLKVGITGGIGSGKTTICRAFSALGIPIYSSDTEAKNILNSKEVLEQLTTLWNTNIVNSDGQADRKVIATLVFNNAEKLNQLNNIIHPLVDNHYNTWVNEQQAPYTLKEAAILFESGAYKQMDKIIAITADIEERWERVKKRDNISREEFDRRVAAQWPQQKIIEHSDFIINNSSSHAVLDELLSIHQQLIQLSEV